MADTPAHATPCSPSACRRWQLRTCESRSRRAARKPWELDDLFGDQLVRPRRPFWSPPKRCDLLVRCAAGGRFLTPFRAHLFGETFWFGGRGAAIVTLTSLHHQKGATFWFRGPEPERRAAPTAEFLTSPRHQKGATFWYRGLGAAILGSDQKGATFWFGSSRVSRPRSRHFGL